jgi:hypothetical protein
MTLNEGCSGFSRRLCSVPGIRPAHVTLRPWTSVGLCHFKHRMVKFFMRKLTTDSPALTLIKVNGTSIRLDYTKAKCFMPTTAYFGFRMRE